VALELVPDLLGRIEFRAYLANHSVCRRG
jgi:hypothetical protein